MSLLEALQERPGSGSKITQILAKVSSEERDALMEALSDTSGWPHSALAETLSTHGHPVSEASVRRYRKDVLRVSL